MKKLLKWLWLPFSVLMTFVIVVVTVAFYLALFGGLIYACYMLYTGGFQL